MTTEVKKYELLKDDTVTTPDGRTLHRIRALVDIECRVRAGNLGGYVETEANLSHYGNAWVFDDAQVYGNAWVYGDARVSDAVWVFDNAVVCGNARVYGNARVFDNAQVYGTAQVSGNAQVYGNARLFDNAWVFDNALVSSKDAIIWFSNIGNAYGTLTCFRGKDNTLLVTLDFFSGTADEFLEKFAEGYNDRIAHEYRLMIEIARLRIGTAQETATEAQEA